MRQLSARPFAAPQFSIPADVTQPATWRSRLRGRRVPVGILVFVPAVLLAVGVLAAFNPYTEISDWVTIFSQAVRQWDDPYSVPFFVNPPWLLALLPHGFLPPSLGLAVNILLTAGVAALVIRRLGGGRWALVLVFTSPFFFELVRWSNIDWVVLVAFLVPPQWGIPILLMKPQSATGAALIWWKRSGFSLRLLVPTAVIVGASFVIWGNWLHSFGLPQHPLYQLWNFSPFPYSIPLGVWLLVKAWRTDDDVLAAVATPLFMPYFGIHSVFVPLVLLAPRYPREALYLNLACWWFFIVEIGRLSVM